MVEVGDGAIIDTLFEALSRGDVDGAAACLATDGVVWHGFDQVAQDRDAVIAGWQALIANFPERTFVDVRREATSTGFVQQHLMIGRVGDRRMAWPCCIVVHMREGRIARIEEYIDRAGHFEPSSDTATTPGLT